MTDTFTSEKTRAADWFRDLRNRIEELWRGVSPLHEPDEDEEGEDGEGESAEEASTEAAV